MDTSHADWIDAFDERAAILEVDAALARTTAEIEAVTDTTRLIVAAHDLDPYWHGVVDGWIRTGLPPAWIIGALILQARAPKADWPITRWPALQQAVADFCSEWAIKARNIGSNVCIR